MEQTTTRSRGMGLLGWMFLVFLVLKLTGYIDWSWIWVTAPLWAPLAAFGAIIIIGSIIAFIVGYRREKSSIRYYGRMTKPRRRSRLRRGGRT